MLLTCVCGLTEDLIPGGPRLASIFIVHPLCDNVKSGPLPTQGDVESDHSFQHRCAQLPHVGTLMASISTNKQSIMDKGICCQTPGTGTDGAPEIPTKGQPSHYLPFIHKHLDATFLYPLLSPPPHPVRLRHLRSFTSIGSASTHISARCLCYTHCGPQGPEVPQVHPVTQPHRLPHAPCTHAHVPYTTPICLFLVKLP